MVATWLSSRYTTRLVLSRKGEASEPMKYSPSPMPYHEGACLTGAHQDLGVVAVDHRDGVSAFYPVEGQANGLRQTEVPLPLYLFD